MLQEIGLIKAAVSLKGVMGIEVLGKSMSPTLRSGDKVAVLAISNARVGDVVVYPGERSSRPVLHRIIGCSEGKVILMGDGGMAPTIIDADRVVALQTGVWVAEMNGWARMPGADCTVSLEIAKLSADVAEVLMGGERAESATLLRTRRECCMRYAEEVRRGRYGAVRFLQEIKAGKGVEA